MHAKGGAVGLDDQLFVLRGFELRRRDVAERMHALQDVLLARFCTRWIDHRVVGRRRFRQAGQHRRFRHGDVAQVFTKIDLGRRLEAEGALAQVDLVHVDLEDLVLGEVFLDLPGQQRFIGLALEGLLGRQEEVACHLLRDGRGALARAAGGVVQGRAQHAPVIDAAVLIEAVVLDRQHRLLHHVRDFLETHERAALFAEFADEDIIGGKNPQRHLGAVVGDGVERRQVRVGHRQREHHQQHADQGQSGQCAERPQEQAFRAVLVRGRGIRRLGGFHAGLHCVDPPHYKSLLWAVARTQPFEVCGMPDKGYYQGNIRVWHPRRIVMFQCRNILSGRTIVATI